MAMLIACWSPKGGSGTTVITAALSVLLARSPIGAGGVLALDAQDPGRRDLASVLGCEPDAEVITHLRTQLWPPPDGGAAPMATAGITVADTGLAGTDAQMALLDRAAHAFAVIRPCYLGVHRLVADPRRVDGLIVIEEPDRALTADDIEHATGRRVVARLRHDPAVARAVDAGLLATRLPRTLRPLRSVLSWT